MEIPMHCPHFIGLEDRSECPSSVDMGNHDELEDMHDEIAINYVELGVLYNRKTIVVDIFFA